jgi:hypothetical protein
VIDGRRLHTKCGWTPYEGRPVHGLPTHTVCRGKILCVHGELVGESGYGRFVPVPVPGAAEAPGAPGAPGARGG